MDEKNKTTATTTPPIPDPHGQAAFLLVESLIHGLIARSSLTVQEAIEIVQIATDVKREVGTEWGDTPPTLEKSLQLLRSISSSLAHDLPKK